MSVITSQRNGIFLEIGAYDGEHFSNTLYFERTLQWRGLLVEPNPASFRLLLKKNRKADILQAAVAPGNTSDLLPF